MWSVVPLMVLGLARVLQAVPGPPEPVIQAQDDFDLARFMGKWYEVAVVSTCPHFMERKHNHPVIIPLQLQRVGSEGNFTRTASLYRNGTCKQMSVHYALTDTPGRFFHRSKRFGADVDSFVVHTNYDDYAMMLQLSKGRPSGHRSTMVKLYSRTTYITAAVLDDFESLVRKHGIDADTIIMNQDEGECVLGEQVTQPQVEKSQ